MELITTVSLFIPLSVSDMLSGRAQLGVKAVHSVILSECDQHTADTVLGCKFL